MFGSGQRNVTVTLAIKVPSLGLIFQVGWRDHFDKWQTTANTYICIEWSLLLPWLRVVCTLSCWVHFLLFFLTLKAFLVFTATFEFLPAAKECNHSFT